MLRESLIPLQHLWSVMLGRNLQCVVHEDNMSTITVVKSGYSPQLRHINKTHRISLGIVHEICAGKDISMNHCDTEKQKGDLFTKGLQRPKHEPAMKMVGLYTLVEILRTPKIPMLCPLIRKLGSDLHPLLIEYLEEDDGNYTYF
jgi:hypothetical protein